MAPATATRHTADGDTSDAFSGITADTAAEVWDVRGPAPEHTAADAYPAIGMARVREILGYPEPFIAEKKEPFLGDFMRRFIAHSTFFCLATRRRQRGRGRQPQRRPAGRGPGTGPLDPGRPRPSGQPHRWHLTSY